jgi:hypothetical protein
MSHVVHVDLQQLLMISACIRLTFPQSCIPHFTRTRQAKASTDERTTGNLQSLHYYLSSIYRESDGSISGFRIRYNIDTIFSKYRDIDVTLVFQ